MPQGTPQTGRKRGTILLPGHDYSARASYFVTICSADRKRCFGELASAGVLHSPLGVLVGQRWKELTKRLPFARLEDHVVMPDHLHGLIHIWSPWGRPLHADGPRRFGPLHRRSLGLVVNLLKGGVTRRGRELGLLGPTTRLWHRGYHDRIIRDARHLANARTYICDNPIRAIESAAPGAGMGWDGRA